MYKVGIPMIFVDAEKAKVFLGIQKGTKRHMIQEL